MQNRYYTVKISAHYCIRLWTIEPPVYLSVCVCKKNNFTVSKEALLAKHVIQINC